MEPLSFRTISRIERALLSGNCPRQLCPLRRTGLPSKTHNRRMYSMRAGQACPDILDKRMQDGTYSPYI